MKTTDNPLVGKFVMFSLMRMPSGRCGTYGAVVRSVTLTAKGALKAARVQMVGGDKILTGTTLSARYRGEKLTLSLSELERARVIIRGKSHPAIPFAIKEIVS